MNPLKTRLMSLVLVAAMLTAMAAPAGAATIVASGECGAQGSNITWTLDSAGLLSLTGMGSMRDFYNGSAPWYSENEKIERVTLSNGITTVGRYAFKDCFYMLSITLPSDLKSIGISAFERCSRLTLASLPSGLTTIGERAFYYCSSLKLTSIPDGVSSIPDEAFYRCEALISITLSRNITGISNRAFYLCSSLTAFSVAADNQYYASVDGVLYNKNKTTAILGPSAKKMWQPLQPTLTAIGESAFNNCTSLVLTSLPNGLTTIEKSAFNNCTSLALTSLPEGLTTIGESAFYNCPNLVLRVLPSKLKTIGAFTFGYCKNLSLTSLPSKVTSIGKNAFMYCSALSVLALPAGIASIDAGTFQGCSGLRELRMRGAMNSAYGAPWGAPCGIDHVIWNAREIVFHCENTTDTVWIDGAKGVLLADAPSPTKQGYQMSWYTDAAKTVPYTYGTPVADDMALYGKWLPRTDTPYKVEHWQQPVAGDAYTKFETDSLQGTTDATATAGQKTYTGFHENAAHTSRVPTGSIVPNGSLLLKLFYDRETYAVTFQSNGGTDVPAQSGIRFQDTVTAPIAPTKTGYDFVGWFADNQLTISYDFSSEVTGDVTLYAKWTPRADTKYRVQHFQQNIIGTGYTLNETDALTGTTDTTATAAAKTYPKFHENAAHISRVPTGTIAPDGSLVLSLYYDRDTFTATFQSNGGTDVAAQSGIRFQGVATPPAAPTKQGYDFAGWYADEKLTISYDFATEVTANVTLYGKWLPRTDTPYKVEHWQQPVTGGVYTKFETDSLQGTTDATATAGQKNYVGFHVAVGHAGELPSGSIAPDGSTVLKLFYDRDTFIATFESNGGNSVPAQSGIRFQDAATKPRVAPTKQGYDFAGWYADEKLTISYDFATEVTANVTLYGKWLPRTDTPYKVEHWQQPVVGDAYTKFETDSLQGTTDATATAGQKSYVGFHVAVGHAGELPSGSIAPDGSTVLKLFYDRDTFIATFESNGGNSVPAQSGIRFQDAATKPRVAPTKQGYNFAGWYADEKLTITFDFTAPITKSITAYAKWAPRTDTPYKVEHWQQPVVGDAYTKFETDSLQGTTDATATAGQKTYTGFHENAAHAGRVPTGSIAPSGSLLLKLFYDRELYTVDFNSAGGSVVLPQKNIRFQGVATPPAAPTKQGYDFAGWYADEKLTISYDFATEVTANVTLYGKWLPRTDTPYKVEHWQQPVAGDAYTKFETDSLQGTTDATATAGQKTYTGFHVAVGHAGELPSGSIAPDGSTVLKLFYDRETYAVTFQSNGGTDVAAQSGIRFQGVATPPAAPTKQGYDFAGWYADEKLTISYDFATEVTANVTLYGAWAPRTDTPYKVEHWQQPVVGDAYTKFETDSLQGTTDATATAGQKSYVGFHVAVGHAGELPSGSIAPDGSTVLKLFYDRDTYAISFDSRGGLPTAPAPITAVFGKPYGTLPTATRAEHSFVGWFARTDGGAKVEAETLADADGARTLYAQWAATGEGVIDGSVVVDDTGTPVADATVTIRAGSKDYKSTTTDKNGLFSVLGVKFGTYNLVAEKHGTIVTSKILLDRAALTQQIVLPQGKTNSIVEVRGQAPEIVVGGLDDLFQDGTVYTPENAAVVAAGGEVALKLTVEQRDKSTAVDADKLAKEIKGTVGLYLDLQLEKQVTASGGGSVIVTALTELTDLMEVYIPLGKDLQARSKYEVYRTHAGQVDAITEKPNEAGEYLSVNEEKTALTLYVKKFSTYALVYPSDVADTTGYRISVTAGSGGTVSPKTKYLSYGQSKTFLITPDRDYRIEDVLVDGKSVGAVSSYTFAQVRKNHTLAVSFTPYCPSARFEDLDTGAWYHETADYVLLRNYYRGTGKTTFTPGGNLTHAEAIQVLARLAGADKPAPAATWYLPATAWAQERGIAEAACVPSDNVTREQLAVLIYRYAAPTVNATGAADRYSDCSSVSAGAKDAVNWAVSTGLLQGDNRELLAPGKTISRIEAAVIFRRFAELQK